ncbi:hypothetical protein PYCCODRAFT_1401461 [Trametes coccinea BRFM310]|uniref:Altered inheritance of mitochondria protein 9, mitochondrial n=1 Tax=Trametes coccinea (strain BRFM310) TaxID=1353009 RepID=A0A1Y2J5V4_TRAC3|nr:hypothetical protein PYCCODRAFT_1401461 [Trametes coccinea BRFM310]
MPLALSRSEAETLFSYTSSRWLCNDEDEREARYVAFDPHALQRIACESVGAEECVSWQKIGEGAFNRVFLLKFNNGVEAAVRIPFPNVGNVGRSVASEVATMCYVRERLRDHRCAAKIPFPPKVFAWNSSYDNPAGTPFIVLEYSKGVPLQQRWLHIQGPDTAAAVLSLGDLEFALLDLQFSQHGSLYFVNDVPEELRNRPLHQEDHPSTDDLARQLDLKYKIGPTANREWWRFSYGRVNANRGPWLDMETMIRSAAEFQIRAIDTGAVDISSSRVKSKPSDIPLLRRMLDICIRIAPLVVPTNPALTAPALNHPDLALSNLIVPSEGPPHIRHSIDWQGATISPFCMQAHVPRAFSYTPGVIPIPDDGTLPVLPDDFDSKTPEEQEYLRMHWRLTGRYVWYNVLIQGGHRLRREAFHLPHYEPLLNLVPFITRCVSEGPADLQGLLIGFQQLWAEIVGDKSTPCPIDFTPEEVAAHAQEVERQAEYERNVAQLYEELGCMNDGSVVPDAYEAAKARMERLREEWDESAMKGPFPFYEGAYSYYLT